jgi:tripartite ATP-independent transporter DctM subunit
MIGIIGGIFAGSALIGVPVAFAVGLAGAFYIVIWEGLPPGVLARIMFYNLNSFAFLAIPLFMLIGVLAEKSGMLDDLVQWLRLFVGRLRGGMAYINVLASMVFAGVSGSAIADVASLGPIEARLMRRYGYRDEFTAALIASSAIIGLIIPPSLGLVIYALAAGRVSIGGLFLAGAVPGVLLGGVLLVLSYLMTRGNPDIDVRERMPLRKLLREMAVQTWRMALFLVLPVIIIGGIVGGVATVTEAAAVGAAYIGIVGGLVLRRLSPRDFIDALVWTGLMTAVVGMLIAGGSTIAWILTRNQATAQLADYLTSISTDPLFFMLVVAVALFIVGMFIDVVMAIIALAPLLAPVAELYGVPTLQFGLVFILAIEIGLITPPVGYLLFMTAAITDVKIERLFVSILPFVLGEFLVVIAVILWQPLTTWLPGMFGFHG